MRIRASKEDPVRYGQTEAASAGWWGEIMLLSLTRVGATRQGLEKGIAVLGADPSHLERAIDRSGLRMNESNRIEAVSGSVGLYVIQAQHAWLGTRPAREQAFGELAQVASRFTEVVLSAGGTAVPTAVGLSGQSAVLGGDTHVIEVLSSVEQEVLANLLRSYVPTLIAMTGRSVATVGAARDRVGSRWLAASRSHLAARYLASTAPQHLERVKAELRRHDGIAQLDRMDIVPEFTNDGSPIVVVRCIDAAPSLAAARAHALVLSALALRARRLVRDGKRVGNVRQRTLEENRARAIADGLRARFVLDEAPARNRRGEGRLGRGEAREPRVAGAREEVRKLLKDMCAEFANLDVTAEELAPLILPVELPQLGLRRVASEGELLARWSTQGDTVLARAAGDAFSDPAMGGALLRSSVQAAPGRVSIVLERWRSWIADPGSARDGGGLPRKDGPRRGQDRDGQGARGRDHHGQDHRRDGHRDNRGNGNRDSRAPRGSGQQRGGS
jgi:hypothetical protein